MRVIECTHARWKNGRHFVTTKEHLTWRNPHRKGGPKPVKVGASGKSLGQAMAILGDQLSEESRTNTGREVFIISVRNPTGAAWRMMISGYPNDDSIAAKVESLLSLLEAAEEEPRDTARILDACSQVRNFWLLGSKSKTTEEDIVSTPRKSLRD